ncbi:MAG TPA: DUF2085 domain-containing protein [Candidatus Methanofastidiosa archaeon]|nr:DUF2085 domain-containing protein [Candidatus Methanofastidiosa archaeon]HPR41087.1 DUF2085 domain-containing protein [Candidatus Methanofastidiosa archaeon]
MRMRTVYLLALGAEIVWLMGIISAPLLKSWGLDATSDNLYSVYRTVCHQRVERSLFIFGEKMAVCSRCFGIYLGLLIGTFLMPIYNKIENPRIPDFKVVLLSLVPLAVDGVTQLAGFRESTNELRLVTGFLFGIIFISYFLPLVIVRLGQSE